MGAAACGGELLTVAEVVWVRVRGCVSVGPYLWVHTRGSMPVGACPWLCAGELLGPTLQFHLIRKQKNFQLKESNLPLLLSSLSVSY